MEEIIKTLPQHTCSWLKGKFTLQKYEDHWHIQEFMDRAILAQQSFKAEPSDVLICSFPKTGTTWLKALTFAIATRDKFDESTSPLLTTLPHECILYLERDLKQIQENQNNSSPQLVATHLPYTSLPDSTIASNCKIVYIYRNIKDVIVSYYHFFRKAMKLPIEETPFEEAFDEFYEGISWYGPYWNHILGYWKASLERPESILLLKYEDMKKHPTSNVKRLAEFIGHPFSTEEVEAGVVDNIIKLCSFDNLSNLDVNRRGMYHQGDESGGVENQLFFRKARDKDWENHFTDEMKEKIDKLIDEKLSGTGLVLK